MQRSSQDRDWDVTLNRRRDWVDAKDFSSQLSEFDLRDLRAEMAEYMDVRFLLFKKMNNESRYFGLILGCLIGIAVSVVCNWIGYAWATHWALLFIGLFSAIFWGLNSHEAGLCQEEYQHHTAEAWRILTK